jgi:PAS domain S-box-containing protein
MAEQDTAPRSPEARAHHAAGGLDAVLSGAQPDREIYFAAVQMSRMAMCLTDPRQPDNPIVFCNQAFERLTGYERAEVLGRNCRFLQGRASDPAAISEIRRAVAAGEDVQQEIYNYRKDGTGFWNGLYISPVLDAAGRLAYHFASQLDVTQRREAEMALRQSQRLEALGGLASSLAHEFNNLMTIVLSSLDRATDEADDARRARQIERAIWGARRATRLTTQMLSFARHQMHDPGTLDLNEMLANFDGILEQMAGAGSNVALQLAPEPLPARLDAAQMELALLNLVRNAADALPGGGEIVIATRATRLSPTGEADTRPAVEVSVADRGTGMAREVALRAAEPFFTTKGHGKGTGLGLSMVSGFAEQSGGRMEIETAPGTGTTIRLVFPRVEDAGPAAA